MSATPKQDAAYALAIKDVVEALREPKINVPVVPGHGLVGSVGCFIESRFSAPSPGPEGEGEITYSERGFAQYATVPATYGAQVRVYESSAAEGRHVWVNVEGECHLEESPREVVGIPAGVAKGSASAHLSEDGARAVRAALAAFLGETAPSEALSPEEAVPVVEAVTREMREFSADHYGDPPVPGPRSRAPLAAWADRLDAREGER